LALGPSFDAIRRKFSTGISVTRYINKDSLSFYTTPIQNEIFGYFSYKEWWVRPSVSMSYGWGSKTEYDKRKFQRYIQLLDQTDDYFIVIRNQQVIRDFSITLSVRKDFDWYEILSNNDNFTFTPVLLLNSGTQNFGFNTSYSYKAPSAVTVNSLPSNRNISDKTRFAPQSMGLILRNSYQIGKILVQPQVLFDYYLQDANDKFNTVLSITGGISF